MAGSSPSDAEGEAAERGSGRTSSAVGSARGSRNGSQQGSMELEEHRDKGEADKSGNAEAAGDGQGDTPETGAAQDTAAGVTDEHSKALGIEISSFDELKVDQKCIAAAIDAWKLFISTAESREAAGEAVYNALFEGAPSLQALFVTPRAVQAMKFMNGLHSLVMDIGDPPKLKASVENLSFGHLGRDVTVPRIVIFRDAIIDLFDVELGSRFSKEARVGWLKLLNYVGGALIYVKSVYSGRIAVLEASWKIASGSHLDEGKDMAIESMEMQDMADKEKSKAKDAESQEKGNQQQQQQVSSHETTVPKSFKEMFDFNAAVMGFGSNLWLKEVTDCFDGLVKNSSVPAQFQEDCAILALRIARVGTSNIVFAEFKSCMLASLRSLLPKDWSTDHEVAWSWLWDNIEKELQTLSGKPSVWEKSLTKLYGSLDENQQYELRKQIYIKFFGLAPAGQDFFKQSNTYLHEIARRIITMTSEIIQEPVKLVDDISALGLRHVGYAIPTDLIGYFVTASVEVVMQFTKDSTTIEAFRWSIGLIGNMLIRTILEGSTIVMKAINANTTKALKKAISSAPRGERAKWILLVQVGTQSISPLYWAVESQNIEAASELISDLLTIRADRDRYYYGMDYLFTRHPDIIKFLFTDAPVLVPVLLDGLIWRSRTTENGMRRVNYYMKHLLVDEAGKFSKTTEWISLSKDPKIVCHPVVMLLSDIVWSRVACRSFLFRKSWFLFTLLLFITSQSVLDNLDKGGDSENGIRIGIFSCRVFIYLFQLLPQIYLHLSKTIRAYRSGDTLRLSRYWRVPNYLSSWQQSGSFALALCLCLMCILEPIFWCLPHMGDDLFIETCDDAKGLRFTYSLFSMLAVLLYYALLLDLAVFSTKVSAYWLVFVRVLSEVCLFLLALAGVVLMFGSAISVVKQNFEDFAGTHKSALTLVHMMLKAISSQHYDALEDEPVVFVAVFAFKITVSVLLFNMLIAQLSCQYERLYEDMVGFARLERMEIIVQTMPQVSKKKWEKFISALMLDKKCEFVAGDVGVSGGIQIREPAGLNPTTFDMVRRFGGSTSISMPWPEETSTEEDEESRYEIMEKLVKKAMKSYDKAQGSRHAKGGPKGSGTGTMSDSKSSDKSDSGDGDQG